MVSINKERLTERSSEKFYEEEKNLFNIKTSTTFL